jgi:dipeptidyl aminopeptidase/acylaminoacyl peptidase
MTSPDFDRTLSDWLDARAPQHAPEHLLGATVHRTARTRPRPAWRTTERWLPMTIALPPAALSRGLVLALVTLGLLVALAAATLYIGARPSFQAAVVPPMGPAANGLIAFEYLGDIHTVRPDGNDRRLVIGETGRQHSPSWSPDGTRIAYWSDGVDGAQLKVVDADGADPVTVASDVLNITDWTPADWSPDGASLAYSGATAMELECADESSVLGNFCSSRIFVAAADGSTGAMQVGDPDLDARGVVWSPDGTKIAFGAGHAERGIGLYTMNPDGTDARRLGDVTGTGWGFLRLGWSPDGSTIVGTASEPTADDVTWNIWATSVHDGSSRIVSDPPAEPEVLDELFPAYASDGALAWSRGGTGACGCLVVLEVGGEPVEIPGVNGGAIWSPDGQLIALAGSGRLLIVDRAGTVLDTIEDVTADSASSWQRLPL